MPSGNMSLEELLSLTQEALERGEKIIIANDIDLTISNGGVDGEDDPRKTRLHPKAAKALKEMEKHGQYIGVISNRSGWQVAGMLMEADIKHAEVIGTFGIEQFILNPKSPHRGAAIIDERFQVYSEPVTLFLRSMRLFLLDKLEQKESTKLHVEVEIPTQNGPIILERKGLCDTFPEGLAAGYNFNLVSPSVRTELVKHMQQHFSALTADAMIHHPVRTMALLNVWRMNHDHDPDESGRYSLKFEPHIKQVKGYGMEHLLRGLRERIDDEVKIGLIIFAGDDNADAEAMRVAANAVAFYNKDLISHRPIQSVGIWVKPQEDKPTVHEQADMIVDGPDGYAEVLEAMAGVVKKTS